MRLQDTLDALDLPSPTYFFNEEKGAYRPCEWICPLNERYQQRNSIYQILNKWFPKRLKIKPALDEGFLLYITPRGFRGSIRVEQSRDDMPATVTEINVAEKRDEDKLIRSLYQPICA